MHVSRTTVILIILALLLLAAAGYLLFGQNNGAGVLTSTASPASSAELTFISLTARIDPVEFDTSILKDPRFAALRDIRTAVTSETTGRTDPFAPLGR
jgi:ABC-type glycerol-3-phosphate transport system substrate-binding protein